VTFNSAEELEKSADLIVIGTPSQALLQTQAVVQLDPGGFVADAYSPTAFNIKSVVKGPKLPQSITVIQGAALVTSLRFPGSYIRIIDQYSPMQKGSNYLLFLKKIDGEMYSILSVTQGKFNIDGTDKEEQTLRKSSEQHANLKSKVMSKYKSAVSQ
jgi:hypothetical protein